jgi:uncharacterized protein
MAQTSHRETGLQAARTDDILYGRDAIVDRSEKINPSFSAIPVAMLSQTRALLLALEYAGLFFGLPLLIWFEALPVRAMTLLYAVTAYCALRLIADRRFDRRALIRVNAFRRELLPLLFRFAIAAGLLTLITVILDAELFLLVRRRPELWARILLMYSLLSALPQEVIYRAYFFQRFKRLFPGRWLIAANVAAFCFLHIIYGNWLAIGLTIPAGIVFPTTYLRTRSLPVVALEHALYGCWIFTIGLGRWFVG